MLLALLLAATTAAPSALPDPASYESVGWLTMALAALIGSANQGMGLIEKFRVSRQPSPGEVSADRVKALEERLMAVEMKWENHMGQITAKFDSIANTLTSLQSDFSYAVGRIDGRHESGT